MDAAGFCTVSRHGAMQQDSPAGNPDEAAKHPIEGGLPHRYGAYVGKEPFLTARR
jgi:hypothetical protein